MSGRDPHEQLAAAAALLVLPKNKKPSKKQRERRADANGAWDYPDSEHLCTLTLHKNSNGATVATISAAGVWLLSATHPAAILAAMYLTNSAVQIQTSKGSKKFDPVWNLDSLPIAVMMQKMGKSTCHFSELASDDDEKDWLEGLWTFSHDDFENPTKEVDEFLRSSQFYLHHLRLGHIIVRPVQTPDPKGWAATLKKRHKFTYYPDL